MGKIIMFGNQKGGVGKSALTTLAANAISSPPFNRTSLVIDADKQQTVIKRRLLDLQDFDGVPSYEVKAMNLKQFMDKKTGVYQAVKENDFVFVDVAGKLDTNLPAEQQEIFKFLAYVHYLFIPFVPGASSMSATLDYLKQVLKYKMKREKEGRPLEVYGLVNMEEAQTIDSKFLKEEIEELKAMVNIKWLKTGLRRYALFRNVDTLESFYSPQSSDKAKQNFSTFIDELYQIVR